MSSLAFRRPAALQRANEWLLRRIDDARVRLSPQWTDPDKRSRNRTRLLIGGPIAAVALGVGGYFVFRPTPQPDFGTAGLDEIFNYTLLTDEFNRLPVEERLALIGQLVQRLRSMDSGDSMMMAAFAAGIAGEARKQIEENASRLAVDVLDGFAVQYATVPPEQQAEFLETSFIEFSKTMEQLGGSPRDVSDEQRLAEAKREATREQERIERRLGRNSERVGGMAGRGFGFMMEAAGRTTTPAQRGRMTGLMRDMTRHLRGQDIRTGKPLQPGQEQPGPGPG